MNDFILTVENLRVGYHRTPLCKPIQAKIPRGARVGVLGPNGCGKSTLVRTLLGITSPLQGHYQWAEPLRLGYVPQERSIDPIFPLTVNNYLEMGRLKNPHIGASTEILSIFDLTGLQFSLVRSLSGGQRQRVLIARALLAKPNVLLLDEAWNSLDRTFKKIFEQFLLTSTWLEGVTPFFVEHDLERLQRLQVNWVFLFTPTEVWFGPMSELLAYPQLMEIIHD